MDTTINNLLARLLFMILCYIPLWLLMFIGKPDRLQGILFDIENFIGLKLFVSIIFFGSLILIGIEAIILLVKRKRSKALFNSFLFLIFGFLYFYSLKNDIFYREGESIPTQVVQATLLISTEGSLYNFNLSENKISWEYHSESVLDGNRNSFVLESQNIFIPFENGKLINFDINTGSIIWEQQIYGQEREGINIGQYQTGSAIDISKLTPLFMSKPLVDKQNIAISSFGNPQRTTPYLYSFNKETGRIVWQKVLPTHFNIFAPLKYKCYPHNYYFINSAIFLEKYGANTGSKYSYGMFEDADGNSHFDEPIYAQMQTDGRSIFIGDEQGKFYALSLNEDAYASKSLGIDNQNSTLKNPTVFDWIFSDSAFTFQENKITFWDDNVLYTVVKNGQATNSAIFAINTNDGILKWKKVVKSNILNWIYTDGQIIGNTPKSIFHLDDGSYTEFDIQRKPLSNIALLDENSFIYVTQSGIEIFDIKAQNATIVFSKEFNDNPYNNVQIEYISN